MSKGTYLQTLYYSPRKNDARELLNTLDSNELYALAQTASNKKILPQTKEEAVDTILLFTVDCEGLLSYKRITNQVLIHYLILNNRKIQGHATRVHLIANILKFWDEKHLKGSDQWQVASPDSPLQTHLPTNSEGANSIIVSYTKSDVFAHDFVEWFYECVNSIHKSSPASTACNDKPTQSLNPSIFCLNASLEIYLVNPTQESAIHKKSHIECESALRKVVTEHRLSFSPNLEGGTCAIKSSHGLVKVLCCGTLHQDSKFIGIFEQEFGLVMNPTDKLWKIFYTKVNLKQAVTELPSLPPCEIFEIES